MKIFDKDFKNKNYGSPHSILFLKANVWYLQNNNQERSFEDLIKIHRQNRKLNFRISLEVKFAANPRVDCCNYWVFINHLRRKKYLRCLLSISYTALYMKIFHRWNFDFKFAIKWISLAARNHLIKLLHLILKLSQILWLRRIKIDDF